ncbi:MAG TPA: hypothetical protein VEF76_02985 [Patescibacteria group bacterium]|nr:hypothetical protein [Patescibacteria group bacterium]
MTSPRPERWIFMIDRDASQADTDTFAAKLESFGADRGVKTVDSFPGTLLVSCDESFARAAEKEFAADLRAVSREKTFELPTTRPRLRKPPSP